MIVRDYDPSIPESSIDTDQLVQALLNLARNGIQAMDGAGTLTLRTRIERRTTIGRALHRQVVCIDVADTGPGIDVALRERMFFPLVTTRADGTGLGLPIAQALVARQGGTIDCTSEPGNTVFTVRLPMEGMA
jgi:two-component system nitrogen regulation sensor histidine kinase GlnL